MLGICQALDHEVHKGLLDRQQANRLKIAQTETVDENVEVKLFDHLVHLDGLVTQVLCKATAFGRQGKRAQNLSAGWRVLICAKLDGVDSK